MIKSIITCCLIFCSTLSFCQNNYEDFNERFQSFINKFNIKGQLDYAQLNYEQIASLSSALDEIDTQELSLHQQNVLDINAYNLLVIQKILDQYPIKSVLDIPLFFTEEFILFDKAISLDKLEERILKNSENPLVHLLLNCGAKSCPSLQYIDPSTELNEYYRNALQDTDIIRIEKSQNAICFSQIFFWYMDDFESLGEKKAWLSEYLDIKIDLELKEKYLEYDWRLNDIISEEYLIYYPTKLFRKGGFELKIFNNYYTQSDMGLRSNFFSSFIQLLIGTNNNFNIGFDIKLRSVNQGDVGLFSALGLKNQVYNISNGIPTFSRFGISGIGPRIKYQPSMNNGNINVLHAIYFVPLENAEGNFEYGYSDYQNVQIFNNVWYEKEFSVKKRLFLDFGFHIENLKLGVQRNENHFMQVVIPVTGIYSYYPSPKSTFYALANYGQKFTFQFDQDKDTEIKLGAYGQIGGGAKYYLTDWMELEALYTYFIDTTPGRTAHTFNIGFRFFK